MKPSTEWKEQIAPDENERFERYARDFVEMQRRKSERFGNGRALHRKQILGLKASFEVLSDLPEAARHGLFAVPGVHEAWLRLSNGSFDRGPDAKPDIRGFAIKVLGVNGPGALGSGDTVSQDFLLINRSVFSFSKSEEFMAFVLAAAKGGGALLKHVLGRYGVFGGIAFMKRLAAGMGKPFKGFACDVFHSAAPIACGPYAVRVRLAPSGNPVPPAGPCDWDQDMKTRLAQAAPVAFDFQLQFFVDEASTPIEDAAVDWEESVAPYVTVARLHIARQDFTDASAREFQDKVEAAVFDPWMALMDHRPLGDVMRARKVVYFASEKARGAV